MTLKSYLGKVLITSTLFSISCSNSWAENVADYGVRLYKNGHAEQAREYFETQIKLKPSDAHAH